MHPLPWNIASRFIHHALAHHQALVGKGGDLNMDRKMRSAAPVSAVSPIRRALPEPKSRLIPAARSICACAAGLSAIRLPCASRLGVPFSSTTPAALAAASASASSLARLAKKVVTSVVSCRTASNPCAISVRLASVNCRVSAVPVALVLRLIVRNAAI
jgi:hypothetical protein